MTQKDQDNLYPKRTDKNSPQQVPGGFKNDFTVGKNSPDLGKSSDNPSAEQPAATMPITQAYEFKRGKHYILEVDRYKVTPEQIKQLNESFFEAKLMVMVIPTNGGDALRPIPTVEPTEHIKEEKS